MALTCCSTAKLLDELEANRPVNVSFFVVGNMVKLHNDDYIREVADGHSIGSHSMTHPDLSQVSVAQLELEISSNEALLASLTCVRPKIFLPPFGAMTNVQLGIAFVRQRNEHLLCII